MNTTSTGLGFDVEAAQQQAPTGSTPEQIAKHLFAAYDDYLTGKVRDALATATVTARETVHRVTEKPGQKPYTTHTITTTYDLTEPMVWNRAIHGDTRLLVADQITVQTTEYSAGEPDVHLTTHARKARSNGTPMGGSRADTERLMLSTRRWVFKDSILPA